MGAGKILAILAVVLLLLPTVAASNAVMSAQQTVLNGEYVTETLEDEGVYEEIAETATEQIQSDLPAIQPTQSDQLPDEISVSQVNETAIVEAAVTEDYVTEQSEENILALYDYLHGETDILELTLDAEPVKENIAEEVARQAGNVETEQLIRTYADDLGSTDIPIDGDTASRMLESESSYQAVKSDFREQIREQVRRETGASGDELDQQVDQALAEGANQTKANITETTRAQTSEFSENVTNATIGLQHALVDGLATDDSYEEFQENIDESEQALALEASRLALQQMDGEIDDTYSLTSEMSPGLESSLRGAQDTVGTIDLMNILLPIIGLVLIALVFGITRSLTTTGKVAGGVFLVAGVLGFLLPTLLQGTVLNWVEDQISSDSDVVGEAVVEIIDGVLGTFAAQSLAILVAGVIIFALAFAGDRGYLDTVTKRAG